MASWAGAIAAGGILAVLGAVGMGFVWFYNNAYSAGKKSAKLAQAEKELEDAKRAGQIMGEQRTTQDTESSLNNGTF